MHASPIYLPRTATEIAADLGVHRLATAMGANIPDAATLSSIEHEKAKLDGALVYIEMQVEQLGAALMPVLQPPVNVEAIKADGSARDRAPEPQYAPLVHDMRFTTDRLHRLSAAIDSLQQRLVL